MPSCHRNICKNNNSNNHTESPVNVLILTVSCRTSLKFKSAIYLILCSKIIKTNTNTILNNFLMAFWEKGLYLFWAVLGLCCCTSFLQLRRVGCSPVAVSGLLTEVASLVEQGLRCSAACEIFLDQGLNLCLLHWQAESYPLDHQGRINQYSEMFLGFFPHSFSSFFIYQHHHMTQNSGPPCCTSHFFTFGHILPLH